MYTINFNVVGIPATSVYKVFTCAAVVCIPGMSWTNSKATVCKHYYSSSKLVVVLMKWTTWAYRWYINTWAFCPCFCLWEEHYSESYSAYCYVSCLVSCFILEYILQYTLIMFTSSYVWQTMHSCDVTYSLWYSKWAILMSTKEDRVHHWVSVQCDKTIPPPYVDPFTNVVLCVCMEHSIYTRSSKFVYGSIYIYMYI